MKAAEKIIKRILDAGYECFIVGGYVRDKLLGINASDVDLATNMKPQQIAELFKDKKVCMVGKQFKVTIVDGIEVATYRVDKQAQGKEGAKNCVPAYAQSIEEDLSRRDTTMNALAMHPITNEIIDLFGGQSDIKRKIVRFVGNPNERIREDYVRILRACRQLAQIEGSFAVSTFEALKQNAHLIKQIEPERIRLEILKVMEVRTPSIFFSALYLIGGLSYIFPEMCKAFKCSGGRYHGESVSEHLLLTGDLISSKYPLLRLAGYLHDIGKPMAHNPKDGSFLNHEQIGGKLVQDYLYRLRFSNYEIETIKNLVHAHMRQCRKLTSRGVRRLQKYLADYNINPRDYIRLKLADRSSNVLKDKTRFTPVRELIINSGIRGNNEAIPLTVRDLAISGGQLIDELGLKPGPIVGKIQKELLEIVIEEGIEYNTYDKLKVLAMEIQSNPHSKIYK